jgi:excisionase family DNA binding protein
MTEKRSGMEPKVLTVIEVAELLRLSRNAAYEAVARKEIPSVRIGRRILIPRVAVEALLAGKTAAS